MNAKLKAALISLAIIALLTAAKFVAYYFSGSLAVYSEAWHSFSDIATTVLVALSIWMSARRDKRIKEGSRNRFWADPERIIAIGVSLWLFVIAITILIQGIGGEAEPVTNPLITGLVFIVLSLGSFFIYRYQAITAEEESSSALKADSQHNRTDMVISLLTGFSLVFYSAGVDVDRFIAILIGLLILLFAIEMAVNAIISMSRKEGDYVTEYRITQIILALFDSQFSQTIGSWVCDVLRIKSERRADINSLFQSGRRLGRLVVILGVVGGFCFWLSTSLFQVQLNQNAVLSRFGKVVDPSAPLLPGLHIKWPWPVDRVTVVDTGTVYTISVGDNTNYKEALIWGRPHGERLEFMSADNNFFLPYLSLHFRVNDPIEFYLNGTEPLSFAKRVCMEELTDAFVKQSFYELALYQRQTWVSSVAKRIQARFDYFHSGLAVVSLDLKDFHPPAEVAKSFEKLVAATQTRETMLNRAQVKRNVMIPKARLVANEKVLQAESEAIKRVSKAEGDTERYLQQLESYKLAPAVMTTHLNLANQKTVLSGRNKIVYDPETGITASQLYQEQFVFGNRFKQPVSNPVVSQRPTGKREDQQRNIRRAPIRD